MGYAKRSNRQHRGADDQLHLWSAQHPFAAVNRNLFQVVTVRHVSVVLAVFAVSAYYKRSALAPFDRQWSLLNLGVVPFSLDAVASHERIAHH